MHKCQHDRCQCLSESNPGAIADERNLYFTGKYMSARDFVDEQAYFLGRHRLHNRLLHGWGVVCGLEVVNHPRADCQASWVVVKPGIALDGYGRELIVHEDMPVPIPKPAANGSGASAPPAPPWLLTLRYCAEGVELVPALYSDSTCDPNLTVASRVRESARARFESYDKFTSDHPECWRECSCEAISRALKECCDEDSGPAPGCVEPSRACGGVVPLARVEPGQDPAADPLVIDLDGRPTVSFRRHTRLTRITDVEGWDHGSCVWFHTLFRENGRLLDCRPLTINFTRKICPDSVRPGTGVGPQTFVVRYENARQGVSGLLRWRRPPALLDNQQSAAFFLDKKALRGVLAGLKGEKIHHRIFKRCTLRVTLACDFLIDCHGQAVDGNFLRAGFKTGDGTPGGTFESWFEVRMRCGRGHKHATQRDEYERDPGNDPDRYGLEEDDDDDQGVDE